MKKHLRLLLAGLAALLAVLFLVQVSLNLWSALRRNPATTDLARSVERLRTITREGAAGGPSQPNRALPVTRVVTTPAGPARSARVEAWLASLREADPARAREGEAVIVFHEGSGYTGFAGAAGSAVQVTGRLPRLLALRIATAQFEELGGLLDRFEEEIADVSPNWKMPLSLPSLEPEPGVHWQIITTAPHLLRILPPLREEQFLRSRDFQAWSRWGRGFLIALLDTGMTASETPDDPTLRFLDVGWGTGPVDQHGTQIGRLIADHDSKDQIQVYRPPRLQATWTAALGRPPPERFLGTGTRGIAPAATLLSVRVTDEQQVGDSFSSAAGIVGAAEAGAHFIVVGPASPEPALVLDLAVGVAVGHGSFLVAATGGDPRSWPAADPRVLGVSSVFARKPPAAGDPAPEFAALVPPPVAGLFRSAVDFEIWPLDSAGSAALAAGAIAAVMTAYPGTTAPEAWVALNAARSDLSHTSGNGNGTAAALYDVLNLGWIEGPYDFTPDPGGVLADSAGEPTGLASATRPGRTNTLRGPAPTGRTFITRNPAAPSRGSNPGNRGSFRQDPASPARGRGGR